MFEEYVELVHLSRLALSGRRQDVQVFIRRLARRLRSVRPDVADELERLLAESPTRDSPLRNNALSAIPMDADSRLKLVRPEFPVVLEVEPLWAPSVKPMLEQIVDERTNTAVLSRAGLLPTRSLLFTGSPGVGKSLAARWIAARLGRPLVTLDLSAVMSSFLGKTGANVRHVLDYAKSMDCVLLLDEFDAVAKRRDDVSEIGELKRLVTVLLQEIDDWPPSGLLVAATNHPDLLDPAVWRRFEMLVKFPLPDDGQVREAVWQLLRGRVSNPQLIHAVSLLLRGLSFSDIERELRLIIRRTAMYSIPTEDALGELARRRSGDLGLEERKQIAELFLLAGFSQRETHDWTGLHRDTIRKLGSPRENAPE
ncbi:MAG: AAA family ATPase [Terriglobales bacterium]